MKIAAVVSAMLGQRSRSSVFILLAPVISFLFDEQPPSRASVTMHDRTGFKPANQFALYSLPVA
jgi:hypothetical protein